MAKATPANEMTLMVRPNANSPRNAASVQSGILSTPTEVEFKLVAEGGATVTNDDAAFDLAVPADASINSMARRRFVNNLVFAVSISRPR